MIHLLQIVGAVLILAGFGLGQFGVLEQRSFPYLLLNLFGGGVLAGSMPSFIRA